MKTEASLKEPLFAFTLVLVLLLGATFLANLLPLLAANLTAIAAILFVGIPYRLLTRQNADLDRYGIALERFPPRQTLFGLLISLLIFPLFALGNHLWETQVLDRQVKVHLQNYRQWDTDLQAPLNTDTHDDLVQLRTQGNDLLIEARASQTTLTATITADQPIQLRAHQVRLHPENSSDPTQTHATHWTLQVQPDSRGRVTLRRADHTEGSFPSTVVVDLHSSDAALLKGAQQVDSPLQAQTGLSWLLLWALTHFLLIALPEEYFYRGYLQTRLDDYFQARGVRPRFLGFSPANWATSALFALGHLLIPIGGSFLLARGAVFFPSLIFGWMRERSGSILPAVIFHGAANMMVLLVSVHYF